MDFLIKQNGDFFELDEEKDFYLARLKQLCAQPSRHLHGYFLHPKEVLILARFASEADVGDFMRSLNSAFARFRKSLRAHKGLKKHSAKQLNLPEFAQAVGLIAHHGGEIFGSQSASSAPEKLSLFERQNALKFKKTNKLQNKEKKMNIVALSSSAHKQLRYHEEVVLQSPAPVVMVSEALGAEHFYPLVFTNSETPHLVALLGRDKNVMLNSQSYLPASVANYPFFWLPNGEEGKESLCIDADAPHFKGDGAPLFNDDGSESEFFAAALEKLKRYRQNMALNEAFIKEILAADVLINKELSVSIDGVKKTLVKGFSVIDRKKLDSLDDALLADWARRGHLEFIHAHLRSLRHLNTLAERIVENED